MGNFSRDTFNPEKGYVGVRLQQGVPLVDADWNELNDVIRHEVYVLGSAWSDGVLPGEYSFEVVPYSSDPPLPNDFSYVPGWALLGGHPLIPGLFKYKSYSSQSWTDPARAARDDVEVIKRLNTPQGRDRTDIVYLDVWEREVTSSEDDELIHPKIGIETSVRLKREAAVRVKEGTDVLPPPAAGHRLLPLALLHRPAKEPTIQRAHIEDIRPIVHLRGSRTISFLPNFQPIAQKLSDSSIKAPPWVFVDLFRALKTDTSAWGVLPLLLPNDAHLESLAVHGFHEGQGQVGFQLFRVQHGAPANLHGVEVSEFYDVLVKEICKPPPNLINTRCAVSDLNRKNVVNNESYYYGLWVFALRTSSATGYSYRAEIHGVSLTYNY